MKIKVKSEGGDGGVRRRYRCKRGTGDINLNGPESKKKGIT
jgi:hypothetical protein